MSPTARSLALLRKRGAVPGVVERWNPGARVRQDFLGFADIVAVEPGRVGSVAVQACVTGDQAKRLAKICAEARARTWLAAANRIVIHGWAKRGPRGKRKTWTLSETVVTEEVIAMTEQPKPAEPTEPAPAPSPEPQAP